MRKKHGLVSVLMTALLCFAAVAWAQEASIFDGTINRIMRVVQFLLLIPLLASSPGAMPMGYSSK